LYAGCAFKFTEAIITRVGCHELCPALGFSDKLPGPARIPTHFEPLTHGGPAIWLSRDTQVASRLAEGPGALCVGGLCLARVSSFWPEWLRRVKSFGDAEGGAGQQPDLALGPHARMALDRKLVEIPDFAASHTAANGGGWHEAGQVRGGHIC
jgi:hypothetical protein